LFVLKFLIKFVKNNKMKKEKPIVEVRWYKVKTEEEYNNLLISLTKLRRKAEKKYSKLKKENNLKSLKELPSGSEVSYATTYITGPGVKFNGVKGKKVKDGRVYMVVDFGEKLGVWKIPYDELKIGDPNISKETASKLANACKNII
jgi:hypothetical protein